MKKKLIWVFALLVIFVGGWLLWQRYNKPFPGEEVPGMGREHTKDITGIEYNSNPPTSGQHFPVWAKKGVYDRVISDGYLIHSLEHGYVVISYNCGEKVSNFQFPIANVYAHEGEEDLSATDSAGATDSASSPQANSAAPLHKMIVSEPFTLANPPPVEVDLPESFKSDECKQLVSQLTDLTNYKERVIVVPRPSLDKRVALTAWGRILKMDKLDVDLAKSFISAFHNRGPEQTME